MPLAKKESAIEYHALEPRADRNWSVGRSTAASDDPFLRTVAPTVSAAVAASTPKSTPSAPRSGTLYAVASWRSRLTTMVPRMQRK